MNVAAVVPVKRLEKSKTRLSKVLSREEIVKLTLTMLADVLNALGSSTVNEVVVVSSDLNVQKFTVNYSVRFLREDGVGLNRAVEQASDWCMRHGVESSLFIPADVPLIVKDDINGVVKTCEEGNQVVISPSRSGGTNALLRKPAKVIPTFFGLRSFHRHVSLMVDMGIKFKVYDSPRIALDVDSVEDLYSVFSIENASATKEYLEERGILERILQLRGSQARPTR
ncbi:MAG: 2-phospho-L-lactate guanylyltransferase [Candidatus Bathyarchaeia archaeon]